MTQPILNPVDLRLLLPLLPAEREFARCLAEGTLCTVGNGELPKEEIESGENANVVRGEVIRFFAYGGELDRHPMRGSAIVLRGAWILGTLDLMHANIPYALDLNCCRFVDSVIMSHAGCNALYLSGSHLAQGLTADGLMVKGDVLLHKGFVAEGEVRLLDANVGGSLSCVGGKFHNPKGYALSADRITAKGELNLCDGFSAKDEVRLLGASVGGDLSCKGGKFHNPKGYALNADGVTTKGEVFLSDGFFAEGEVRMLGANVGGDLSCEGGRFHNPKGTALSADRLTTKDDVFLSGGFSAEGGVCLPGANVGGNLSCVGGKFHNPGGCALIADGITTKGEVFLSDGFSAEGEVRLLGASVGGSLSCASGKFHNPKKHALSADGVTTKGDVRLRGGFSAEGEVRLPGANVGGNLSCVGGKFHNPNGYALIADGMTTKGGVLLSDDFSAEGEVRLSGASIGRRLSCVGGRFHNLGGRALNVESAIINGGFIWREIIGGGAVNLGYAKIGVFADEPFAWKPFKACLDGCVYNQILGPIDAQSRLDWLGNRPLGMHFSPLPYEQAARVLFEMGYAKDAREILLEKERLQTADERTPWHHKIGRRLWDVFAGYGYRLRYTLGWMAFFIYTGTSVFLDADLQHRIVPHQSVVLVDRDYQDAVSEGKKPTEFVPEMFSGYPEFNQFWLSVDIFIPLFNLHQETHWIPARDERGGFPWITLWYWIEIVAGWILTSLLLLSITGLLRPRQSSGEKG